MAVNPVTRKGAMNLASATTGGGEKLPSMYLRPAIVTAIDRTVSPWTCTIEVQEVRYPGITMLGWYDPQVGDPVMVTQQGTEFFILGTLAPGKVYMPPVPPPAPPAPPAPVAPPAAIRTVSIQPISSGTYPAESPLGGWRTNKLCQGGVAQLQRAYWFYNTQIADAKAGGTILGGTIFIKRTNDYAGVSGGANVRLGSHGYYAIGGSPGALSNVTNVGSLLRDQGHAWTIPADIIAGMNSGAIKGLGLEPGAAGYTHPDYLLAYAFAAGQEWSGSLSLTIQG